MTVLPNVRDHSVGCFWKDPGLLEIQTVINCTNSLFRAIIEENCKNALMTTWHYKTAHARNKVVPPSNFNTTVHKKLQHNSP